MFLCLILLFIELISASVTHTETYTYVTKWGSEGVTMDNFMVHGACFRFLR